jgi:glycosyltransferase involved in cell wall biosynthesis
MHNIIGLSTGIIHAAKRFGARTVLTLHDYWGFCFKNTIIKRQNEICADSHQCHECMPTIHDGADRNIPIRMRNDYLRLVFDEADYLVSPSLYLAQQFARAGFPVSKLRVVWNGIDLERFSRVEKTPRDGRVRFTYIGNLAPHKGVGTLIEALPLLGDPGRFHINVVGSGHLTESLRARARQLGHESSVSFFGQVQNARIEDVFAVTDVLVLPSVWPENQPVSVTEAMATRTPVIASSLGGMSELVVDGLSGSLFEAGNCRDLAAKMALYLDAPERIDAFGDRGFERIAGNSFDQQILKLLRIYDARLVQTTPAVLAPLIVCAGERVDPVCGDALRAVQSDTAFPHCRFVMSEWLTRYQIEHAAAVWVVGKSPSTECLRVAERASIPVITPEGEGEVPDRATLQCTYRDSAGAVGALLRIISFDKRGIL